MLTMPTPYGAEFRQDVIDVARKGEAPLAQIAKDFGLSVTTIKRWLAIVERKESGAVLQRRAPVPGPCRIPRGCADSGRRSFRMASWRGWT